MFKRFGFRQKVYCLIFCCLAFTCRAAERAVFTDSNVSFEIVGVDRRSVAYVKELSAQVELICRRLLNDEEKGYPDRIFVALRPEEGARDIAVYRVSMVARGAVRVDFKWDASLDLRTTCQGLARAYLRRYIFFREGLTSPELLPEWLVSALSNQVYMQLRPSVMSAYLKRMRESAIPSLDQVFAPVLSLDDTELSDWGFWCFVALRESGYRNDAFRALAYAALKGESVLARLEALLTSGAGLPDDSDSSTWWIEVLSTIRSSNFELYEPIEVSHEWIRQMSDFSDLEFSDEIVLGNLKDVWKHRKNPELRKALTARREIIVLRLQQVNPAYYNAAGALGGLFETILDSDQLSEFISSLSEFLGEFEDMKRLEAVLLEEMDA